MKLASFVDFKGYYQLNEKQCTNNDIFRLKDINTASEKESIVSSFVGVGSIVGICSPILDKLSNPCVPGSTLATLHVLFGNPSVECDYHSRRRLRLTRLRSVSVAWWVERRGINDEKETRGICTSHGIRSIYIFRYIRT